VLDAEERLEGFRSLPRDEAEDYFLELNTRSHVILLQGMSQREKRTWLRVLPARRPRGRDARVLLGGARRAARDARRGLAARGGAWLLAYAEDEAGGLMNPRFARVRPEMTVEEAIRYVRRQAQDKLETIYYVYVLDGAQHLLGVVSFRELLLAPGDKPVREVMHEDVITVPEEMDQEEVARVIAQHDILAGAGRGRRAAREGHRHRRRRGRRRRDRGHRGHPEDRR
jgi:magnesium transporter